MLTHGNSREVAYKFHADCQDASSRGFKRFRATVEQDIAAIDAGAPAPLQPPPAPKLTFVLPPELPNNTAEAGEEGARIRPSCGTRCRCNRTPSARQRRCRQHGRGGGVMQATAPHPSHRSDDFSRGFGVLLFRNRSMGRALTFYTVLRPCSGCSSSSPASSCCTANARSAQRSPISGRRSSLMSSAVTSANGRCGPAAAGRDGHPRRSWPSPGSRMSPATLATVCCGVCVLATVLTVPLGIVMHRAIKSFGRRMLTGKYLRGAVKVSDDELARQVRRKRQATPFTHRQGAAAGGQRVRAPGLHRRSRHRQDPGDPGPARCHPCARRCGRHLRQQGHLHQPLLRRRSVATCC